VQLSETAPKFKSLGISIVAVTYDDQVDAKKFHSRNNLGFPIVKDEDSSLIKALGILNTGPEPGDGAYGIPYPGTFLVDNQGIIRGKFAEQDYRNRPDNNLILNAAAKLTPSKPGE